MKDNPDALPACPIGHMQLHLHPQPRKMLQTPGEIVIIWEANYGVRHIYTDGRTSPTNDPQPWWYGYTVGKWEGDTLVATTTNLRDGMWLDVNEGAPPTRGRLSSASAGRTSGRSKSTSPSKIRRRSRNRHRAAKSAHHGRQRADRVHLQRKRAVVGPLRQVSSVRTRVDTRRVLIILPDASQMTCSTFTHVSDVDRAVLIRSLQ